MMQVQYLVHCNTSPPHQSTFIREYSPYCSTIYLHPQHGHQSHNQSTSGSNYFQLIWWCNLYGADPFICSRYRDSVIVSFSWIDFVYSSSVQVFYKIRYICCVLLQGEATSIGQSDTGSAGSPQRTPSRRGPCARTLFTSPRRTLNRLRIILIGVIYIHPAPGWLIRNLYLVFFATLGIINLIIK